MSQQQHQLSIDLLESKIRYCGIKNTENLIAEYLQQLNMLLSRQHQNTDKFKVAERSAFVFFDTISDKTMLQAWRLACVEGFTKCIELMNQFCYSKCDSQKLRFMKLRLKVVEQSLQVKYE
ncbi:MAG: hypothetical protein AAGJ37_15310 [Pseudomonadota bacterium]